MFGIQRIGNATDVRESDERLKDGGGRRALPLPLFRGASLDGLVQALHQRLIVAVGSHVGGNASPDGEAEEIEVADQVQDLMAHEFVGIAELGVDDFAVVHDDV